MATDISAPLPETGMAVSAIEEIRRKSRLDFIESACLAAAIFLAVCLSAALSVLVYLL